MDIRKDVIGILVSGYPAPGINSAISSAVIEAVNRDYSVVGFYSGWSFLREGISKERKMLVISDVSRIHQKGGSFLKTSKCQLDSAVHVDNALAVIKHLRIHRLVVIGSPFSAMSLAKLSSAAKRSQYKLSTMLILKSIFNDLPLPSYCLTFGFSTAREFGAKVATQYYKDARANDCWYIINVMGSRAGHFCLGVGRSSAATLSLIQEEFDKSDKPLSFKTIVDHVQACVIKRKVLGKNYGLILLSEGLVDIMDPKETSAQFSSLEVGHSELAQKVSKEISKREREQGKIETKFVCRDIGFEVRCADPDSTDHDIARNLGYGAIHYSHNIFENSAKNGEKNGEKNYSKKSIDLIITQTENELVCVDLAKFLGIKTLEFDKKGENKSCTELLKNFQWQPVQMNSLGYRVAIKYMIRLKKSDLNNAKMVYKLARNFGSENSEEFIAKFSSVAVDD